MKLETIAIHYQQEPDPITGAISQSICPSTTYERDVDGGYSKGHAYSRDSNPNRDLLEQLVAKMEGGSHGVAFASGMAAISACIQSLETGDHIIFPNDLYFGLRNLLAKVFGRWGLTWSFVDMRDLTKIERALTPRTKMIWIESPSNPLIRISDISAISNIAYNAGAICICDNTWPTPLLQRPFELGADIIVHSSTKYFGGHSDVMGGIVIAKEETPMYQNIREIQKEAGAVPSPYDCWLITRGLHTLSVRLNSQCDAADNIARFLATKLGAENVFYPGLPSHSGHEVAKKQMKRFGAMLSFTIPGSRENSMKLATNLKLIKHATSLGGTHTLIEHRESVEGPDTLAPPNLLRLSVGLEHVDDLIKDLDDAIDRA